MKVLNATPAWAAPAAPDAAAVARRLQALVLQLQAAFFAEDGSGVDYVRLANSEEFAAYREATRELQAVDGAALSDETTRRCFFLNIYNALTLHAIADASAAAPIQSVLDVPQFWSTAYVIGSVVLTLDDIEHGVLRGNRPHPSSFGRTYWPAADPRVRLVLPLDPRVHFALVCGAKSCPPIRVFTGENLERGLAAAAASFVAANIKVTAAGGVEASQLLQWYGGDFGSTQTAGARYDRGSC